MRLIPLFTFSPPNTHTEDRAEKQLLDSCDAHSSLDGCTTERIPLGPSRQARRGI